jgi:hypothetical protein
MELKPPVIKAENRMVAVKDWGDMGQSVRTFSFLDT